MQVEHFPVTLTDKTQLGETNLLPFQRGLDGEEQRQSKAFHTPPAHFFPFMPSFPAPLPLPWWLQLTDKKTPCHSSLLLHSSASWRGISEKEGAGMGHTGGSGSGCGGDKQGCAGMVDDVWLSC